MLPIYLQRGGNNYYEYNESGNYISSINGSTHGIEYNASKVNDNPMDISIHHFGGKKRTKNKSRRKKTKRKKRSKRSKKKSKSNFNKLCKCDRNKKIRKKKQSPEAYGMCPHCSPIGIIMKGKNGNMWKNVKKPNGNHWLEIRL